jgi:hypothetical protein
MLLFFILHVLVDLFIFMKSNLQYTRNNNSGTVGISYRRLVNLCLRIWLGWCAKRTQGYIVVRVKCPYVQSLLLMLLALNVCSRGYKRAREDEVPSLW